MKQEKEVTKFDPEQDITYNLNGIAKVVYYANFLKGDKHEKLFNHLKEDINVKWKHGVYNMYGKKVLTPRLLWAMRDEDGQVNEKYKVSDSGPWTDKVKKIKELIEKKIKRELGYAQLNYYRDGNDYIGWHSDRELEDGDIIASLSLGCSRRFLLRSKTDDTKEYEFLLKPGSLLVLNYACAKRDFKHCIPKEKSVTDSRINITFRNK